MLKKLTITGQERADFAEGWFGEDRVVVPGSTQTVHLSPRHLVLSWPAQLALAGKFAQAGATWRQLGFLGDEHGEAFANVKT